MVNAPTKQPDDFVIATGRMETVRKFIKITAEKLGCILKSNFQLFGKVLDEVGKEPIMVK